MTFASITSVDDDVETKQAVQKVGNKTIFDGVHYIGGLDEGQNLYQYFNYIDILDLITLKKLDENGFDIVTFDNDPIEYKHAQRIRSFFKIINSTVSRRRKSHK